jgi:hypothetical protein
MKPMVKKVLSKSKNPVGRLLGFREWCEKVWEPTQRMKAERWYSLGGKFLNTPQGTVHGRR